MSLVIKSLVHFRVHLARVKALRPKPYSLADSGGTKEELEGGEGEGKGVGGRLLNGGVKVP